jgi:hypothetical protein
VASPSENAAAPTIEPTTVAVRLGSDIRCVLVT